MDRASSPDILPDIDVGKLSFLRHARGLGILFVLLAVIFGAASFLVLLGLTRIEPTFPVIVTTMIINVVLVILLSVLVGRELLRLIQARRGGRAAARMHINLVGLFGIIAAFPAILVAIVAGITLNSGLDRIFDDRSRTIVESSVSVAKSYAEETTGTLLGHMTIMANSLRRNRQMFDLDRRGFRNFMTGQGRELGMIGAFIVNSSGEAIVRADIPVRGVLPPPPIDLITQASDGRPACISPRVRNLSACATLMPELGRDYYLYTLRLVDSSVLNTLQLMEELRGEYQSLESGRIPLQVAFALLYFGICLTILLSAIWIGISVADRLVAPIRQLISAADSVRTGNLDIRVRTPKSLGELRSLSDTFNAMTTDLRNQRDEIMSNQEQIDSRRRFTEAVLSGVSSGVIGVSGKGTIVITNSSAIDMFNALSSSTNEQFLGKQLSDISPELYEVVLSARSSRRRQFRQQISFMRQGHEHIYNIQVTLESPDSQEDSTVITIDDITDLISAQRTSAWSDVARRIAHEIKNPLTPIQLSAERLRRRYSKTITNDKDIFDQCTETIIRQVSDIGRMVDEFSSFAQTPKPAMEDGDLSAPLQEAIFVVKVGNTNIDFQFDSSSHDLPASFDSRQLTQAFGNLLKNATESIASCRYKSGDQRFIKIVPSRDGDMHIIDIIDNGKGLPSEHRQRLLEPYMTTRDKGTGLGLAIVSKILEEHGGSIQLLDSPDGKGAQVRVRIPALEEAA